MVSRREIDTLRLRLRAVARAADGIATHAEDLHCLGYERAVHGIGATSAGQELAGVHPVARGADAGANGGGSMIQYDGTSDG